MRVGIFGSKTWSDYMDLVRHITLFIEQSHHLGHENIIFVHTAQQGAENMVTEYIGKTERFLKQKQFRIKEEIKRNRGKAVDYFDVIESGIEYAIIFHDGDKRTQNIPNILKEYNIPFNMIKKA